MDEFQILNNINARFYIPNARVKIALNLEQT